MVRAVVRDLILPSIVFPSLVALAFHFIFGHLRKSSIDSDVTIAHACAPGLAEATPYRLRYVGLESIDNALCPLVTVFQTAINSQDLLTLITYFIGVGAPLIIVPAVEGLRAGRSRFIAYPIICGLLSQTMTAGVAMPLYWLIFILTGGTKPASHRNPGNTSISQADAEAVVFGIVVGAVIPSAGMLALNDPYVTAIWQFFPIYILVAQCLHLLFRPSSKYSQSGHQTIRGLYIAAFVLSSSIHIATIWPSVGDLHMVRRVFLPSVAIPRETIENKVQHLLKWDLAVAFISSILVTFWFASTRRQLALLVAWSVFATPVLGPGAAIMGAHLWWQEASIRNASEVAT